MEVSPHQRRQPRPGLSPPQPPGVDQQPQSRPLIRPPQSGQLRGPGEASCQCHVSNAFIICSPLYDPIIILVMELILLHIFHALSISHLTLRASPQIRLLSQVQSRWPSLTVTRLFQSEDSSPLSQSCVASAQTIPSHPPAKTVSIVDYYSQVGHPLETETRKSFRVLMNYIFFLILISLLASLEYHEF